MERHGASRAVRRAAAITRDIYRQAWVCAGLASLVLRGRPGRRRHADGRLPPRRSVLFISYYAPPYRSAYGTQRGAATMKYLVRLGWEVALLTTAPSEDHETDASGDQLPDAVHVVRIPGVARASHDRGLPELAPDRMLHWIGPAADAAVGIVAARGVSVIVATGPPYSALIAGALAAARCDLPFVSDFRDAWSRIDRWWTIRNPVLRRVSALLERLVLHASARIVIVSEREYLDEFLAPVGPTTRARVVSITNGFDEEDFRDLPPASPAARARFVVSYAGMLYDRTTCAALLRPFRLWHERHPDDLQHVTLVYAGLQSALLAGAGPFPFEVQDRGHLTHREAVALRTHSDLQLFALPADLRAHVYSGKLFEMLRAGVPILAMADPAGAAGRLIARARAGDVFPATQPAEAAAALKRQFDRWRRGESPAGADAAVISAYSRERLARAFSDQLDEVMGQTP